MQLHNTLQEICKASTMHTAMAMSKFLNTPIRFDMKPLEIELVQKIDLPNHSDESTVGLLVNIDSNSIKGGSLMISSTKSALAACDLMLSRKEGHTNIITSVEESALKEFANIVLGNFLTFFAHSLFTTSLLHGPARYELDTSNAIAKHTRSMLSNTIGENTAINIAFTYQNTHVNGDINIVLDANKINALLTKMMALTNG